MSYFIQQVLNALVTSSLYVLLGLGASQIYGILEISHFAHGSVMMMGGYLAYTFFTMMGMNLFLSLFLGMICGALLGVIIEKFFYRPAMKGPMINVFIIAYGLMYIFQNIAQQIWGSKQVAIVSPFNNTVSIFGATITTMRVIVFVVDVALVLGMMFLMFKTPLGRSIRAMAQNKDAAIMVGVNVGMNSSIIFALGSALAALAGGFMGTILSVFTTMGGDMVLKAFTVMIIGGLGSIPGIIVGGLLLGFVETFGAAIISAAYKNVFGFILIILILVFKPEGLLTKSRK